MKVKQFPVGASLSKDFGGVLYTGWIVKREFDNTEQDDIYHVKYEDDDEEDLYTEEIRQLVWPAEIDRDLDQLEAGHLVAFWNYAEPSGGSKGTVQCRFTLGKVEAVDMDENEVSVKPLKTVTQKRGQMPRFIEQPRSSQMRQFGLERKMETEGLICFGFTLSEQGYLDAQWTEMFFKVGLFH